MLLVLISCYLWPCSAYLPSLMLCMHMNLMQVETMLCMHMNTMQVKMMLCMLRNILQVDNMICKFVITSLSHMPPCLTCGSNPSMSWLCQVPSFYPLCAIAICKRWDCVWGWVNLKDIKHKLGNLPIKLGLPIGNLPIKLGLPNCLKICNVFWKHDGHDT